MSDPFRDELEAAHQRIEKLEAEHRARVDKLEKENQRLQKRLVEIAPSRTKTGRTFLALAMMTMALSIGAGIVFARVVRAPGAPIPVQVVDTAIELGPAPQKATPADFDRDAVSTALDTVRIDDCVDASRKPGSGHVRLVLLANGFVASARVDRGVYATTSEGRCIEERLRAARVPSWTGTPRTVGKAFDIH